MEAGPNADQRLEIAVRKLITQRYQIRHWGICASMGKSMSLIGDLVRTLKRYSAFGIGSSLVLDIGLPMFVSLMFVSVVRPAKRLAASAAIECYFGA